MHILIFSQHFWPESFRINDLAKDLCNQGIDVSVLTGKPNYPKGKIFKGYKAWGIEVEKYDQIIIYRVPMLPRGESGAVGLLLNYLSFLFSSFLLGFFLTRKIKIDIVFVYGTSPLIQGLSAIPLKIFHKARLLTWVQDLWPDDLVTTGYIKNPFILKINSYLASILYASSDKILIQSEGFRSPVQALTSNTKIFLLPNPIERSVFLGNINPLPSELFFLESGFNILFAGNIGNNQSIDTVIAAAKILKNLHEIRIVFVGDGSRLSYLKDQIKLGNLFNLVTVGRYPSEMMPSIFSKASALLVTLAKKDSLSRTIPSRIQAYMAAGIPIIGSLDGVPALTIETAGAGLVSPAEDVIGLVDCIKRLHGMSKQERDQMGSRGRKFAEENYHPEKIANELIKYCSDELLSSEAV